MRYVSLNNIIKPAEELTLSLNNRGFFYGDGFFESVRVFNGKPFNFKNHLKRIRFALKILSLDIKISEIDLLNTIEILLNKNNIIKGGRLKIVIYRESSGKYFADTDEAYIFMQAELLTSNKFLINREGLKLDWYEKERKAKTYISNIKTLNSLHYVLAAKYAQKNNLDDAILLNTDSRPIESSNSNIFFIKNNIIYTPKIQEGCVSGTMRALILSILKVQEISAEKTSILNADEIFLSSSMGIKWIKEISHQKFQNYSYATNVIRELNQLI